MVYFEINGPDGEALARFYSSLFGWRTEQILGQGYWLIDTHAGGGINGGIGTTEGRGAYLTFYVESKVPEALMEKAERAGARVIVPITQTPSVTFGQFADLDGLIVGIVKAEEQGGRSVSPGKNPPVDWFEILGSNVERTQRFYQQVFGWQTDDGAASGYLLVQHEHDDEGRDLQMGGGFRSGKGSKWITVYAKVPEVEATLQKAEEFGGERTYGPQHVGATLTTGAFADPAGNVFGVYQA